MVIYDEVMEVMLWCKGNIVYLLLFWDNFNKDYKYDDEIDIEEEKKVLEVL